MKTNKGTLAKAKGRLGAKHASKRKTNHQQKEDQAKDALAKRN